MPSPATSSTQNSSTRDSKFNKLTQASSLLLTSRLIPLSKRFAQVLLLCFVAFTMLGAGDPSTRFDKLGHQLMCTCGCGEILLECNHMGCPTSPGMIADLHAQVATGLPNGGVLNWFAAKYGPIVLAAPIRGGFDIVAWVVPFAVLALGIGAVIVLMRLWRQRHEQNTLAHPTGTPPFHASAGLRDRIRRETNYEP